MTRRITPKLIQVLDLLTDHPDGISGYDICRTLKLKGPTIYKMLERLVTDGWASSTARPSRFPGSPPVKLITLTETGTVKANEISGRPDRTNRNVARG